jgi:hypothetical protein
VGDFHLLFFASFLAHSAVGHFRRLEAIAGESGLPPTPDELRHQSEPTFNRKLLKAIQKGRIERMRPRRVGRTGDRDPHLDYRSAFDVIPLDYPFCSELHIRLALT